MTAPDIDYIKHLIREVEQERIILTELEGEITKKSIDLTEKQKQVELKAAKNTKESFEIEQQREILDELNKLVAINKQEIRNIKDAQVKKNEKNNQSIRELEQEKEFLMQLNQCSEEMLNSLNHKNTELEQKISILSHDFNENAQENLAQKEVIKEQSIRLNKKHSVIIALVAVTITIVAIQSVMFATMLAGEQYRVETRSIHDGYVIQNLRGDKIDTWLSWRLVSGTTLHVGIENSVKYPDKVSLIKELIQSDESIQIDDSLMHKGPKGNISTYFVGWSGALKEAAKKSTQFNIPTSFDVVESVNGEGEITIILTEQKSGDGYSGYTKNIADESQNQILKSSVTIFEIDRLSNEEFKTILRHELGHVFGLAHSTASEDLMHPIIETNYPYISQCDISALQSLYDGGKKSEVVCQK